MVFWCDAHEWLGHGTDRHACICLRCGLVAPMRDLPTGGCDPHLVSEKSGWLPMKTPPQEAA